MTAPTSAALTMPLAARDCTMSSQSMKSVHLIKRNARLILSSTSLLVVPSSKLSSGRFPGYGMANAFVIVSPSV